MHAEILRLVQQGKKSAAAAVAAVVHAPGARCASYTDRADYGCLRESFAGTVLKLSWF